MIKDVVALIKCFRHGSTEDKGKGCSQLEVSDSELEGILKRLKVENGKRRRDLEQNEDNKYDGWWMERETALPPVSLFPMQLVH